MHELKAANRRIVGLKQTVKAIKGDKTEKVYIAENADDFVKDSVLDACKNKNVQIVYLNTMKELGEACGIDIGASTAAVLKD